MILTGHLKPDTGLAVPVPLNISVKNLAKRGNLFWRFRLPHWLPFAGVTMKKLERYRNEFFPSDVIDTWTLADWDKFCSPCLKHPARYCSIPNRNCHYSLSPSSCDSMDLNGAGSNLNEEHCTAMKAGCDGPEGRNPSRLIYANLHGTPDTSLNCWGLS